MQLQHRQSLLGSCSLRRRRAAWVFRANKPQASATAEKAEKPAAPEKKKGKGSPAAQSSPEDVRTVRLQKVQDLRTKGQNPYAYRFNRTHYTEELQSLYAGLAPGAEDEGRTPVAVAGRVMAKRVMGKLAFLSIRDDRGQIQLYVERGRLEEAQPDGFELLKGLVDVGDIVGCTGTVKRTEKGELSVVAGGLEVLTKSLLPLPDKWHGLADVEKRYRQRYLDLIMTAPTRDTFRSRSRVISTLRRQLEDRGFLEISYQGVDIDLGAPFRRASMAELVRQGCGLDLEPALAAAAAATGPEAVAAVLAEAKTAAEAALMAHPDKDVRRGIAKVRAATTVGRLLNELFEAVAEAGLMQPTFVTEHPTDISPLAKPHRSKPGVTERFELFIYGSIAGGSGEGRGDG
ncbi:hypothetical protein GPECTOR_99g822 [Gonium pectorale]|uniref:lysine--tRNA ligase n=1 Tax=Gonium pectorale TaxID=33097 RepID=A0A150G023_GONPE|nr:hypothetical protein GPECTOR_99g822 [Gonium pectorale]|eukprot:KXZ43187.1 hypothetical protein GPECTOR_99g822 [Gonium pectorale]